MWNDVARAIAPPVLWRVAAAVRARVATSPFSGDFRTFEDVAAFTAGYESAPMLEYAARSNEGLRNLAGPLVDARTMRVVAAVGLAVRDAAPLRVLDLGGGLGAHYQQLRRFFPVADWLVIETPAMVARSVPFRDGVLRFSHDMNAATAGMRPDVVLASGTLQYVADPHETLARLVRLGAQALLVDRVPLIEGGRDRLTVQRVAVPAGAATLPAWFFDEARLFAPLARDHDCVLRWQVPEDGAPAIDGASGVGSRATFGGALWRRRS